MLWDMVGRCQLADADNRVHTFEQNAARHKIPELCTDPHPLDHRPPKLAIANCLGCCCMRVTVCSLYFNYPCLFARLTAV
mmetsp:Transcript_13531/g.47770  ORF Transcript_13531/g.47770 Transcript_13531/m.47770 type:complete len:80 (+) Transcript_13531:101-340(+)